MPRSLPGAVTGLPVDQHLAAVGLVEAGDHAQEGGFSAAGGSQQNAELADVAAVGRKGVLHFEVDVLQSLDPLAAGRGEAAADVANGDFEFLVSMASPLSYALAADHGSVPKNLRPTSCLPPGKEALFQQASADSGTGSRNADGDDSGVDAFEIEDFARRLDHVADALFARSPSPPGSRRSSRYRRGCGTSRRSTGTRRETSATERGAAWRPACMPFPAGCHPRG